MAASLAAKHELLDAGSVVVACRLSCSVASGIFLDQGLNLCPFPALAGVFLTPGLPGKSPELTYFITGNLFLLTTFTHHFSSSFFKIFAV